MTSLRLLIFSSLLLFVSFFVPVYCIPFLATTKRSLQLKKHLNFQQQNLTWFNISVVDVVWSWFPVKRVLFYFSLLFNKSRVTSKRCPHLIVSIITSQMCLMMNPFHCVNESLLTIHSSCWRSSFEEMSCCDSSSTWTFLCINETCHLFIVLLFSFLWFFCDTHSM